MINLKSGMTWSYVWDARLWPPIGPKCPQRTTVSVRGASSMKLNLKSNSKFGLVLSCRIYFLDIKTLTVQSY